MGTLNPDLLSKDMDAIMNDAAELRREFNQQSIQPELLLLALIRRPETAAARLFKVFAELRGVEVEKLERQVKLAAQSRRDQNGNLDFVVRGNKKVPLSRQTIILLDDALSIAQAQHEVRIDTDHALTVLSEPSMSTSGLLRQEGITPKAIQDTWTDSTDYGSVKANGTVRNLVKTATQAVHFREDLLREIINVLGQTVNRHVILLGRDGVGKRTLAYSLGLLMKEGRGPVGLSNLVQIDETALLDNDLQALRAGISKAKNGILLIPNVHRFFGGPIKAEFSKATSLLQKAFLDDDPVIIATTTDNEYGQRLANVTSITENSQIIRVEEATPEEAEDMLKVSKPHIERQYDLIIDDEAIKLTVNLAKRYLAATPLPRSAFHLMHRTASMVRNSDNDPFRTEQTSPDGVLDSNDVMLAASEMTGIPLDQLGEDERERLANMEAHLHQDIKGQDEAVEVVSKAIKTARVGLKDPRQPIGKFLFLGPTGVGKTELARKLAQFMFGTEEAMLPLDMSEFKDESSINRLIGSPTGYVGSEDGGQLTEKVRQTPYIIVLFDEIEKAHPRIMDILLQVMEEGRLTDGRGVVTRFTDAVIILTSNIGSEYLSVPNLTEEIKEQVWEDLQDPSVSGLRPEFLNRLDEVVMFNALDDAALEEIMWLLLAKEQKLIAERGIDLTFTEGAVKYMLSLNDEPEYGARPLKRIIRRELREPLADFLLKANPGAGTEVNVSKSRKKDGGLKFTAEVAGEEVVLEH